MDNQFEQIREQIHEIRNFLGPLDIKLDNLDRQIAKSRFSFESKASELESRMVEQSAELALHAEQIRQIQIFLKMPQVIERPVREDKQSSLKPPE